MVLHSPRKRAEKLFASAKRLVRADRYNAALAALNQALQQAPTAQLYDYRAVVLSLTLQTEAALESFTRALEITLRDSERAEIYFHRGLLYGREQLYDLALLDFSRACRLNRCDPTYREAHDHARSCCGGGSAAPDGEVEATERGEEAEWTETTLLL